MKRSWKTHSSTDNISIFNKILSIYKLNETVTDNRAICKHFYTRQDNNYNMPKAQRLSWYVHTRHRPIGPSRNTAEDAMPYASQHINGFIFVEFMSCDTLKTYFRHFQSCSTYSEFRFRGGPTPKRKHLFCTFRLEFPYESSRRPETRFRFFYNFQLKVIWNALWQLTMLRALPAT